MFVATNKAHNVGKRANIDVSKCCALEDHLRNTVNIEEKLRHAAHLNVETFKGPQFASQIAAIKNDVSFLVPIEITFQYGRREFQGVQCSVFSVKFGLRP